MTAFHDSAEEAEVDRLYQVPLDQFITARTDLAKRLGGARAQSVRALPKPNVLAWALNQLYWSRRETFDRLVAAAAQLRAAQADALLGRRADLRTTGEAHREAIREALRGATAILHASSHAVTPDGIRELTGALEALPWKDRAGRLVRPPAASGFDALAGLPIAPPGPARAKQDAIRAVEKREPPKAEPQPKATSSRGSAGARREHEAAVKAARAASTAARREEAQAASRLQRAEKQLEAAREREATARQSLREAERDRSRAEEERREAAAALEAARRLAAEAARRLDTLEPR